MKLSEIKLPSEKFLIPVAITVASPMFSLKAVLVLSTQNSTFTVAQQAFYACIWLIFSFLCDVADGTYAKQTNTESAFRRHLDSLTDTLNFGLAPALICYKACSFGNVPILGFIPPFLFIIAGMLRLARFDIMAIGDDGKPVPPSDYMTGLSIPAAAGTLVGIVLSNRGQMESWTKWPMMALMSLLAFLMVSSLKLPSFKNFKPNPITIGAVAVAAVIGLFIWAKLGLTAVILLSLVAYVSTPYWEPELQKLLNAEEPPTKYATAAAAEPGKSATHEAKRE